MAELKTGWLQTQGGRRTDKFRVFGLGWRRGEFPHGRRWQPAATPSRWRAARHCARLPRPHSSRRREDELPSRGLATGEEGQHSTAQWAAASMHAGIKFKKPSLPLLSRPLPTLAHSPPHPLAQHGDSRQEPALSEGRSAVGGRAMAQVFFFPFLSFPRALSLLLCLSFSGLSAWPIATAQGRAAPRRRRQPRPLPLT